MRRQMHLIHCDRLDCHPGALPCLFNTALSPSNQALGAIPSPLSSKAQRVLGDRAFSSECIGTINLNFKLANQDLE